MSPTRKIFLFIALPLILILGALTVYYLGFSNNDNLNGSAQTDANDTAEKNALRAGKQLSNNRCKGEGVPYKLSHSPMEPEDFTHIIPYGLMVGGHVTPIDHQYFSPKDYRSPVDAYEVYAMADSSLVDIGTRTNKVHPATEYRLVFSVSCTFLYYYDLVTSLAPEIKTILDERGRDGFFSGNIPVKAGQIIGRIGGRTLDFAVWDTTKPLQGFVNPASYTGEAWKIYTADPLDYYTDELRQFILSRYVRTAEPISGKIDHDIDGKLIGNWFLEGSNGYAGPGGGQDGYWIGHLAIAPDHYDPTQTIVSMGFLYKKVGSDDQMQYMVLPGAMSPAEVGVDSGLARYDLARWEYSKTDGSSWDKTTIADGVIAKSDPSRHFGCVLAQLTERRQLKFELFLERACDEVSDFTVQARLYAR